LDFEFFWYALRQEPDETWHPIFKQAVAFISQRVEPSPYVRNWPKCEVLT
jgi:hypothetical protein